MRQKRRSRLGRHLRSPYYVGFHLVPLLLLSISFLFTLLVALMLTVIELTIGGGMAHFGYSAWAWFAYALASLLIWLLIGFQRRNVVRWRREKLGWIMPALIGIAGIVSMAIVFRPFVHVGE